LELIMSPWKFLLLFGGVSKALAQACLPFPPVLECWMSRLLSCTSSPCLGFFSKARGCKLTSRNLVMADTVIPSFSTQHGHTQHLHSR
jgi:hypothetical protein